MSGNVKKFIESNEILGVGFGEKISMAYEKHMQTGAAKPRQQRKQDYENIFNIIHSKCYTEYGLTRTGCAGCPFGNDFEQELDVLQKYEPKLYKACNNIFGESYEYTRKYREFYKEMEQKCAKK